MPSHGPDPGLARWERTLAAQRAYYRAVSEATWPRRLWLLGAGLLAVLSTIVLVLLLVSVLFTAAFGTGGSSGRDADRGYQDSRTSHSSSIATAARSSITAQAM